MHLEWKFVLSLCIEFRGLAKNAMYLECATSIGNSALNKIVAGVKVVTRDLRHKFMCTWYIEAGWGRVRAVRRDCRCGTA